MLTAALSGSSAYGGSSGPAQRSPIKLGVLTPLPGALRALGRPGARRGGHAVNEINRSGGVKGGQGRRLNLVVADDQSVNTTAAIDGFRRLTQQEDVVSVGGHHRQPYRAGDHAARRGGEGAAVPDEGGEQRDPDGEQLHVPYPSARGCDGGCSVVQLAERGISSVGRDHRRLRVGPVVQVVARGGGKKAPNIRFNIQVAPLPTTNFTPYLRALGDVSLIVATGHPPGAGLILAAVGTARDQAPVGAYSPYSLTAKNAGAAVRPLERLQVHGRRRVRRATLAKRYLRTFPQNEFFEDDALSGYAYVKIVAEAISRVESTGRGSRLRPRPHVQHPGVRVALWWTAWGELGGPAAVRHPDQGRAARARAEHRHHLLAEGALQVAAADALPSPS